MKSNGSAVLLESGVAMPELGATAISDGGEMYVELSSPYRAKVRIKGTAPILLHRYDVASVEEKGAAAKGSKGKKTDDVVSFAYRTDEGLLGVGGYMFAACIREAGRSEPDPRSPRKSMRDLLASLVIPVEDVAPFVPHTKEWDFIDRRRAVIQRAAVTRSRPAMHTGWELTFTLDIGSGDYLPPAMLRKLVVNAGRFLGLADGRPTFGRFDMVGFEIVAYED